MLIFFSDATTWCFITCFVIALILIRFSVKIAKMRKKNKKELIDDEVNLEKGKQILNSPNNEIQKIIDSVPADAYEAFLYRYSNIDMSLASCYIWKEDKIIHLVSKPTDVFIRKVGSGKVNKKEHVTFSFNIEDITLVEKEAGADVVTKIWLSSSPKDICINFSKDDYSLLNRLINE